MRVLACSKSVDDASPLGQCVLQLCGRVGEPPLQVFDVGRLQRDALGRIRG